MSNGRLVLPEFGIDVEIIEPKTGAEMIERGYVTRHNWQDGLVSIDWLKAQPNWICDHNTDNWMRTDRASGRRLKLEREFYAMRNERDALRDELREARQDLLKTSRDLNAALMDALSFATNGRVKAREAAPHE